MKSKTIKLKVSADMQVLCEIFGITAEELLTQFIADLCSEGGSGGSDERTMAKEYFLRGSLSTNEEWLWDNNENVLDDFAWLYLSAYPTNDDNGKWQKQRTLLLNELREKWQNVRLTYNETNA
jgi:hypothetical protein